MPDRAVAAANVTRCIATSISRRLATSADLLNRSGRSRPRSHRDGIGPDRAIEGLQADTWVGVARQSVAARSLRTSRSYVVQREWSTVVIEGTHLSIHTDPDQVLSAVESLVDAFPA